MVPLRNVFAADAVLLAVLTFMTFFVNWILVINYRLKRRQIEPNPTFMTYAKVPLERPFLFIIPIGIGLASFGCWIASHVV